MNLVGSMEQSVTDSVTMLKYNTSCELILILICYQIVIFWSTATVWHDIWLIWRLICLYLSHCLPYTSIILLLLPSSIYLFWYFHNNQVSESLQRHVLCQSNSSYKSNLILTFFNDFTWSLTIKCAPILRRIFLMTTSNCIIFWIFSLWF